MDFSFFNEADQAAFNLEKAKRTLELAKSSLDSAKTAFEDVMARADDYGVPRAKLKKIIEERVQALFDSGLVALEGGSARDSVSAKAAPKPKRNKKGNESATPESETVFDEAMADGDADELPQA